MPTNLADWSIVRYKMMALSPRRHQMNGRQVGFRPLSPRIRQTVQQQPEMACNRHSEGHLASLDTIMLMSALCAEEQEWPGVREITTAHIEVCLAHPKYYNDDFRETGWKSIHTATDPSSSGACASLLTASKSAARVSSPDNSSL